MNAPESSRQAIVATARNDGYLDEQGENEYMLSLCNPESEFQNMRPDPQLDQGTRAEAEAAVKAALANYKRPGLLSRMRTEAWLWFYMFKLRIGVMLVNFLSRPGSGRDSRLVSQRVWRRLGL